MTVPAAECHVSSDKQLRIPKRSLHSALIKGGERAERWLEPGTEYAKSLPLDEEWYKGIDLGGMNLGTHNVKLENGASEFGAVHACFNLKNVVNPCGSLCPCICIWAPGFDLQKSQLITFGKPHSHLKISGMERASGLARVSAADSCVCLCAASSTKRPKRYFPFAEGPRNCVGQSLAKVSLVATAATLLSTFHFKLADQVPSCAA